MGGVSCACRVWLCGMELGVWVCVRERRELGLVSQSLCAAVSWCSPPWCVGWIGKERNVRERRGRSPGFASVLPLSPVLLP
ncbi:hypothetical protein LOK49_LG06G01052 [Camellia lanceoleosa]|uniref:Uncharacterized protein n=1 Tax=Camellia lanceoleosa TaxID=1840588 RepID=A0ACC0H9Q0_9ERIC|nr:hypothetical protein LOK49_LG06G01052 [Camellia lanceoleosa]